MTTKYKEIECPKGKITGKQPSKFAKNQNATVDSCYCRNNCSEYKKGICEVWKK